MRAGDDVTETQCKAHEPTDIDNRCQLPSTHKGVCQLRYPNGHGSAVAGVKWEDR